MQAVLLLGHGAQLLHEHHDGHRHGQAETDDEQREQAAEQVIRDLLATDRYAHALRRRLREAGLLPEIAH